MALEDTFLWSGLWRRDDDVKLGPIPGGGDEARLCWVLVRKGLHCPQGCPNGSRNWDMQEG